MFLLEGIEQLFEGNILGTYIIYTCAHLLFFKEIKILTSPDSDIQLGMQNDAVPLTSVKLL